MPLRSVPTQQRRRDGTWADGRAILYECDVCGAPALYGFDVSLRAAMDGNKVAMGRWYCRAHLPALGVADSDGGPEQVAAVNPPDANT